MAAPETHRILILRDELVRSRLDLPPLRRTGLELRVAAGMVDAVELVKRGGVALVVVTEDGSDPSPAEACRVLREASVAPPTVGLLHRSGAEGACARALLAAGGVLLGPWDMPSDALVELLAGHTGLRLRTAWRRPVEMLGQWTAAHAGHGRGVVMPVRLVELGVRGCRLQAREPLVVDARGQLTFVLPHGGGRVRVSSEVRREVDGTRAEYALEFVDVPEDVARGLEDHLRRGGN